MRTTLADIAVRTMPEFRARRSTPPRVLGGFAERLAEQLGEADGRATPRRMPGRSDTLASTPLDPADLAGAFGPPPTPERAELLARARGLLGIPYVWGGDSPTGLDCSSFLSRIWGVARQTTDTLSKVADPITKDDLRAGDAMNLPIWKDPSRHGHVRMFDRWADASKSKMWVYEETSDTGAAVHRVIDYDPRYQPMRLKGLD